MNDRSVTIPDIYTARIERTLSRLGTSLNQPKRLAEAVLRLSDHYIKNPDAPTPWEQNWAEIAYACYFFPLNYARVLGVVREGVRVGFFDGLSSFTDFGSGVGTVPLALADGISGNFKDGLAIERSAIPERTYRELVGIGAAELAWNRSAPKSDGRRRNGHMTAFSFSLTELAGLPAWAKQSEALMLVEPGTHQDGRKLLALRQELLADGYSVWAPCTHQGECPLLKESARDWCHDRVALNPPPWFAELSEHLPMRNPTLTCSYLLLRRSAAPASLTGLARLTGDLRKEKGASRQMVCRGSTREFLSWQAKHGEAPGWPRGGLVELPSELVIKGKELRLLPTDGHLVD